MRFYFWRSTGVGDIPWSNERSKILTASSRSSIVNYRNTPTFKGRTNKAKAKLVRFAFFVDSPVSNVVGTVRFTIEQNSSVTSPTWNSLNSDSIVEYDLLGTPIKKKTILTEYMGYAGGNKSTALASSDFGAEKLGLVAYPGDEFSVIGEEIGGNDGIIGRVVLNWNELF